MVGAPLAGALAGRIGTRPLLATGLALQPARLARFVTIVSAPGGCRRSWRR
jgi:hypothetical protein